MSVTGYKLSTLFCKTKTHSHIICTQIIRNQTYTLLLSLIWYLVWCSFSLSFQLFFKLWLLGLLSDKFLQYFSIVDCAVYEFKFLYLFFFIVINSNFNLLRYVPLTYFYPIKTPISRTLHLKLNQQFKLWTCLYLNTDVLCSTHIPKYYLDFLYVLT